MAKKDAYFWRGKGGLKIDRLYATGEKIPHNLMAESTLAALIKSGEVQTAPFDVVESAGEVSRLEKKIKELSGEIVKLNKKDNSDECESCKTLTAELAEANEKVEKFEKEVSDLNELINEGTD